jgi:hypothetical protein
MFNPGTDQKIKRTLGWAGFYHRSFPTNHNTEKEKQIAKSHLE